MKTVALLKSTPFISIDYISLSFEMVISFALLLLFFLNRDNKNVHVYIKTRQAYEEDPFELI